VVVQPSSKRLWGKILVGSGVALAGVGAGLGFYGRSQYWNQFPSGASDGADVSDAAHHCFTAMSTRHCDAIGASHVSTARKLEQAGIITGVVGVVAAGVGAYLWITSPAQVTVEVDRDRATVAVTARW
jgi:hypothetical protein